MSFFRFSVFFLIYFLVFNLANAAKIDKAFRFLEKQEFAKAIELFNELLDKNELNSAARYGLAEIYSNPEFNDVDLNQAYGQISIAETDYQKNDSEDRESAKSVGVNGVQISMLKDKIETFLLQVYIDSNTVSALNLYMEKYPEASNAGTCKVLRNNLAFRLALKDKSVKDMEEFLELYPDAEQVSEGIKFRDQWAFEEAYSKNTIEGYDYFINRYPEAEQKEKAMEFRGLLAYNDLIENEKSLDSIQHQLEKAEINRQKEVLNERITWLTTGIISVLVLMALVIISFVRLRKAKNEIVAQKEMIEEKNTQILDSINYAKRIQEAILPDKTLIQSHFKDFFIFYKPRDIVSGDFYWFAETKDKIFVAAVDCTGHGVPGAFMSMIGNRLLNQSVHIESLNTPAEILFNLRKEVIKALNQTGADDEAKDGMDMALLAFSKDRKKVEYSGAFNPLYMIRNGELQQIKADRQPISSYFGKDEAPFTNHSFDLNQGDFLYIFTDGFADQFGGPEDKKFSARKMRELLLNVCDKPSEEQHSLIEKEINIWMENHEQIDDMLIIGLRS